MRVWRNWSTYITWVDIFWLFGSNGVLNKAFCIGILTGRQIGLSFELEGIDTHVIGFVLFAGSTFSVTGCSVGEEVVTLI